MKRVVISVAVIAFIVLIAVGAFIAGSVYGQQQVQNPRAVTRLDSLPIAIEVDPQTAEGQIAQRALDELYKDEYLRSHLDDDEAKIVFDWAKRWIEEKIMSAQDTPSAEQTVQSELARIRPVISAMNTMAGQPGELSLANAVAELEPALNVAPGMSRVQLFRLLTTLTSATWKAQSR